MDVSDAKDTEQQPPNLTEYLSANISEESSSDSRSFQSIKKTSIRSNRVGQGIQYGKKIYRLDPGGIEENGSRIKPESAKNTETIKALNAKKAVLKKTSAPNTMIKKEKTLPKRAESKEVLQKKIRRETSVRKRKYKS